jgi:hypothetical protein
MTGTYPHYKIAQDWAFALGNGHARDCESRGFALAIGGGVVAVVGHSDGETIEGTTPEEVGDEILSLPGFDSTHKVILCACNTGRGSFAGRLSRKLQSAGKRVEIMAPNEPTNRVAAAGAHEWVVDPQGAVDWRDIGNWTLIF